MSASRVARATLSAVLVAAGALAGCAGADAPDGPRGLLPPPAERPADPWVLRSVLDERPRVVTIGLADDLWLAYDATTCTPYRAWSDGVHFDGAVYTTIHGPQPTSRGEPYRTWYDAAWWLEHDGRVWDATPRWRGYRFHDGYVTLRYDLAFDGGRIVARLEETPERGVDAPGAPTLELLRLFSVDGLPDDGLLRLVSFLPPDPRAGNGGLEGAGPGPRPVSGVTLRGNGTHAASSRWARRADEPADDAADDAPRAGGPDDAGEHGEQAAQDDTGAES